MFLEGYNSYQSKEGDSVYSIIIITYFVTIGFWYEVNVFELKLTRNLVNRTREIP